MDWLQDAALAAWAQAILSVIAILASAGIAIWVPHRDRMKHAREMTRIADALAKTAEILIRNAAATFSNRERIHFIHVGDEHFDTEALAELARQLAQMPLYQLGSADTALNMMLIQDYVRVTRYNIDATLTNYRSMHSDDFDRLAMQMSDAAEATRRAQLAIASQLQRGRVCTP